jgi:23S rRNA pseudouridine1911/1915/1917 synthase
MSETARRPFELTIPPDYAGLRLDQALARLLPNQSRSRLQAWILSKQVTVENREATAKHRVWGGEKVHINPVPFPVESAYAPEAISLDILHEDESLLVVNKPAGLVVHPGSGNWQGTMLNALLHHAPHLTGIPRAGIVHRLDKDTSGLLVVAKTPEAQTSLVRQLQERSMKRVYIALVLGDVTDDGSVDAPIGRHSVHRTKMAVVVGGKEARTHFQVVEKLKGCTLLRCSHETGRTHQIRVHMHSLGHPLVGDPVYGGKRLGIEPEARRLIADFPRQALHAAQLELVHPRIGRQMTWDAPLPEDMRKLLLMLHQLGNGNTS